MARQIDSKFDPQAIEARWLDAWEAAGAFRPEYTADNNPDADQNDPFCIVIPPPNVTGELHVGHALDQTVQDVLTRAARKQGRKSLWLPGMDHAGIATQLVVTRQLADRQINYRDLGRQNFIDEV